jgi:hypothetical protein
MAYSKRILTLTLGLGGILMSAAVVFSQAQRSGAPPVANRIAPGEVGTFQLLNVIKNGENVLYRINTKTGQVWSYSEYAIVDSASVGATGAAKEGLDKLIGQAARDKKNVYTLPFWDVTAETAPTMYTVH